MTNLSGKTALVTGASRGIGRATALALATAGAQVVIHYGSGANEAEAVVAEWRGRRPRRRRWRGSVRARRCAQARQTGSRRGRRPAGYPRRQCRNLESSVMGALWNCREHPTCALWRYLA
jgi:NAD(P)-dependent dehydrogenase (short-subunit alcohol dehydrogenase family)